MKPKIRLLITDLDNTLYDWITSFVSAFYGMVEQASTLLQVDKDILLNELRETHQKNKDTEQAFSLLETKTVLKRYGNLSRLQRMEILDTAFHEFNRIRDKTLKLYPDVATTLSRIHAANCSIVAHTEANVNNAIFRLQKLGLVKFFNSLYAILDTGEGHPDPVRKAVYDRPGIRIRELHSHERKPAAGVLEEICHDYRVNPEETLYVGDSISRDIGMAKSAGVWSAWARYGTVYNPSLWTQLVRVTHWTDEDVKRAELAQKRYGHTRPDITLNNFEELLQHFVFCS